MGSSCQGGLHTREAWHQPSRQVIPGPLHGADPPRIRMRPPRRGKDSLRPKTKSALSTKRELFSRYVSTTICRTIQSLNAKTCKVMKPLCETLFAEIRMLISFPAILNSTGYKLRLLGIWVLPCATLRYFKSLSCISCALRLFRLGRKEYSGDPGQGA